MVEVGNTFGHLTVMGISSTRKYNKRSWDCRCVCGNTKVCTTQELTKGWIRSCGCMSSMYRNESRMRKLRAAEDEIHREQRFGALVTIRPLRPDESGDPVWRVYCECGRTVNVSADDLLSGNMLSCGCMPDDRARERAHMAELVDRAVALTKRLIPDHESKL